LIPPETLVLTRDLPVLPGAIVLYVSVTVTEMMISTPMQDVDAGFGLT
jgi:hypothetical protein